MSWLWRKKCRNLQRAKGENARKEKLLPYTDVQGEKHGHRHQEHQKISHHVQNAVRQIEIGQLQACALQRRIPESGDRMTGEDEGKCDGDHVADGDEHDDKNDVAEFAIRVDAEVEDEDGDFGQGDGGDVYDCCSRSPLVCKVSI